MAPKKKTKPKNGCSDLAFSHKTTASGFLALAAINQAAHPHHPDDPAPLFGPLEPPSLIPTPTLLPPTTSLCCALCQKPATRTCKRCKDAPTIVTGTKPFEVFYCSNKCRKVHWPIHQSTCERLRHRIHLRRAAETLRVLWLITRKHTWDLCLTAVKSEGRKMCMLEGDYRDKNASGRAMHTFPSKLVNTIARRDTLLTFMSSHKAIGYLHWLAEKLFDGLCEYGEELTFIHKPCGIDVILRREGGAETSSANIPHHAWAVALKNGEVWVLDPCAAWRGFRSPLMYWDEFMSKRVIRVKNRSPLGDMAKALATDPWESTNPYSIYIGLQEKFIAGFWERECSNAEPSLTSNDHDTTQMLRGTQLQFEKKLYNFARDFDNGLASAVAYLYFPSGGLLLTTEFEQTFVRILLSAGVCQEDILDEDPCDTKGLYDHFVDIIERSGDLIPTEGDTQSEQEIPTTSCARCKSPAVETCGACRGAPIYDELTTPVYYCNRTCQEAHWSFHKAKCKRLGQRIALRRAAGLLNGFWRVTRHQLWDVDIQSVTYDEEKGKAVLHEGDYSSFTEGRIFSMFPNGLKVDGSHKHDRAVAWDGYDKAMYLLEDVARVMLQEVATDIEEVHLKIKPPKVRVLLKTLDGQNSRTLVRHSYQRVLKVTLKSGEIWMLDFVSGPERRGRMIESWKSYVQDNVSVIFHPAPIHERVSTFSVYPERQIPPMDMWRWSIWSAFIQQLGEFSRVIEHSTNTKLPDLLKGSSAKFQSKVAEVVKLVGVLIRTVLEEFYGSKQLWHDMPKATLKEMFKKSGTKVEQLDGLYPNPNALEQYVLSILRGAA